MSISCIDRTNWHKNECFLDSKKKIETTVLEYYKTKNLASNLFDNYQIPPLYQTHIETINQTQIIEVDIHTGGTWFTRGTQHHMGNYNINK